MSPRNHARVRCVIWLPNLSVRLVCACALAASDWWRVRCRYSPLHAAAYNNRYQVVTLVLRLAREHQPDDPVGAVRKMLSLATSNGNTALHLAARLGHVQVVDALLAKLDLLDAPAAAELLGKKNFESRAGLTHAHSAEEIAESNGHLGAAERLRAKRLSFQNLLNT